MLSVFFLVALLSPHASRAQTQIGTSTYKSDTDQLLTLDRVALIAISDNLQGIFSRPLETHLREVLRRMHRWDVVDLNLAGAILTPDEYGADPEKVKAVVGGADADGVFIGRATKGPSGVSLSLALFLKRDGKLIAQASMKDERMFEVQDLKEQIEILLGRILEQIPYQGRILSRDGQRVTLNIGKLDGIQNGQIVSSIQLIALKRHPKFNFLVSSEKETLGRIKIVKSEDTLSFGVIVAEKEVGTIQKGSKLTGLDFVTYPEVEGFAPTEGSSLAGRGDQKVTFGDNPKPWLPTKAPSFGRVGAKLGLSQFSASTNLTGIASLESSTSLAPGIYLDGELWITQDLSVHAGIRNAIIAVSNPRSGSSPSTLNQSLTQYEFLFGYDWRFGNPAYGPKLTALLGYMTQRLYVDDSSPRAYTTRDYSGFQAGIKGSMPIPNYDRWGVGAALYMVLLAKLSETPATTGSSSSNSINLFGIFSTYKWRENISLEFGLDFEMFSSSLTGTGTRAESGTSMSHRLTTLTAGMSYYF